jgi:hypothetical protein
MWRVWDIEVHTWFWWGDVKEREHLKDLGVDGRTILKRISKTWDGNVWTGLI